MTSAVLTAFVIGVVSEVSAYQQHLWVYRRPVYAVLNVVVMFAPVMGFIATLAASVGVLAAFAIGFAVGLLYEIVNFAYLDWWYFPGDRLYMLRGKRACALAVAVAWGVVPVIAAAVRGLV